MNQTLKLLSAYLFFFQKYKIFFNINIIELNKHFPNANIDGIELSTEMYEKAIENCEKLAITANIINADFIKHIIATDLGAFYNNAIALISTNLMIADGSRDMTNINLFLNEEEMKTQPAKSKTAKTKGKTKGKTTMALDEVGDESMQAPIQLEEPAINTADKLACNKIKVIAKRYIELDELNEDNGKEIFFDKKYDTTAYDIGEKFKADSNMSHSEQIQHYIAKLMN
jgi:hypothetical protein